MEQVTIPKSEYEQLLRDSLKLEALDRHGVDNWEGYDDAMDTYRELLDDTSQ